MIEHTIRHRTLGDVGGFASATEATAAAIEIGWPLEDWTIELVEAPELADVAAFAPFADLPQTPARDRALERWARS
jgi:hypothetical protein